MASLAFLPFCSSVSVQYNTRKQKSGDNGEGLGTRIRAHTDTHTHTDEHPPVLCHCPPGWTVVVVVCMQTVLLLSPGHC